MHPRFASAVEALHAKFEALMALPPLRPADPKPKQGIYLFSEGEQHLYVGRSNNIPTRYAGHCRASASFNSTAFAMLLAREATGKKASYKPGPDNRKDLILDPTFLEAFGQAKARIRAMEFRTIGEDDQTRQTLLEVYCDVVLQTLYNDFGTH